MAPFRNVSTGTYRRGALAVVQTLFLVVLPGHKNKAWALPSVNDTNSDITDLLPGGKLLVPGDNPEDEAALLDPIATQSPTVQMGTGFMVGCVLGVILYVMVKMMKRAFNRALEEHAREMGMTSAQPSV